MYLFGLWVGHSPPVEPAESSGDISRYVAHPTDKSGKSLGGIEKCAEKRSVYAFVM